MFQARKRLISLALAGALASGGLVIASAPANAASPAATAFNQCITPYVDAANTIGAGSANAQKAVLYTGYANCYYALSQRSDISGQQEIDAINNYNSYYSKASTYIIKTGVKAYEKFLNTFKLVGLKG